MRYNARASVSGAVCHGEDLGGLQDSDLEVPAAGEGFFYLVRGDAISPQMGTYDSVGSPPEGAEGRDCQLAIPGGGACAHQR